MNGGICLFYFILIPLLLEQFLFVFQKYSAAIKWELATLYNNWWLQEDVVFFSLFPILDLVSDYLLPNQGKETGWCISFDSDTMICSWCEV